MGYLFGGGGGNVWATVKPQDWIPPRLMPRGGAPYVDEQQALTISAVWSALRIRADLVSSLPLYCYRDAEFGGMVTGVEDLPTGSVRIDADKGPFFNSPSVNDMSFEEWLWASQFELDRNGNTMGLIQSKDRNGFPMRIDLVPTRRWSVVADHVTGEIKKWKLDGADVPVKMVWHERANPIPGSPLGLSPIAYAAYTLQEYKSVEEFIVNWYVSSAVPRARLKNVNRELDSKESIVVKESWRASLATGEPFVHGSDWEYDTIQAEQASTDWLESKRMTSVEVARYIGVPASIIDASVSGQAITYQNMSMKDLDFLIHFLGPALQRRERKFSRNLVPRPRYLTFDSDALLRMDPITRAEWIRMQIEGRFLCPSEARAMYNRKPFTDKQIDEFERLGLNKTATGALAAEVPGLGVPSGTQTAPMDADKAQGNGEQPPTKTPPAKGEQPPEKGNGGKP